MCNITNYDVYDVDSDLLNIKTETSNIIQLQNDTHTLSEINTVISESSQISEESYKIAYLTLESILVRYGIDIREISFSNNGVISTEQHTLSLETLNNFVATGRKAIRNVIEKIISFFKKIYSKILNFLFSRTEYLMKYNEASKADIKARSKHPLVKFIVAECKAGNYYDYKLTAAGEQLEIPSVQFKPQHRIVVKPVFSPTTPSYNLKAVLSSNSFNLIDTFNDVSIGSTYMLRVFDDIKRARNGALSIAEYNRIIEEIFNSFTTEFKLNGDNIFDFYPVIGSTDNIISQYRTDKLSRVLSGLGIKGICNAIMLQRANDNFAKNDEQKTLFIFDIQTITATKHNMKHYFSFEYSEYKDTLTFDKRKEILLALRKNADMMSKYENQLSKQYDETSVFLKRAENLASKDTDDNLVYMAELESRYGIAMCNMFSDILELYKQTWSLMEWLIQTDLCRDFISFK